MKVNLRKTVRKSSGALIRPEHVEQPGVLTVTGLLPSLIQSSAQPEEEPSESVERERSSIVDTLLRRVGYLLTLKGRPPFRMAGIEMFEGLQEVCECVESLIAYVLDERLVELQKGLSQALSSVCDEYKDLRQAANWLNSISELLDPEGKSPRTGDEVKKELFAYLDQVMEQSKANETLAHWPPASTRPRSAMPLDFSTPTMCQVCREPTMTGKASSEASTNVCCAQRVRKGQQNA